MVLHMTTPQTAEQMVAALEMSLGLRSASEERRKLDAQIAALDLIVLAAQRASIDAKIKRALAPFNLGGKS